MSRKLMLQTMALNLSLLVGCGSPQESSNLDGHFENGSVRELNQLNGAQRATAEHEPSKGVIISLPLIQEYQRADMAAAILKSGVDTLWITVPSNFTGSVNSNVFARLRQAAGANINKVKLVRQQTSGNLTVWARDWAPLSAKTNDGGIRLLDFNYYTSRKADDFTAQSFERLLDFDRLSVPVYNEGGNFMNNSEGHCMMTTRVTDANRVRERADDYILSARDIQNLYGMSAGCKKTTIFPRMPFEGTGHIDMWAKFMDDDTLIVSELRNEVLNLYRGSERTRTAQIQKYLNDRASEIRAMGYRVIRIPIPGPVWSDSGDTFRSYTNSLIVNDDAIVPRYTKPAYNDLATANGTYIDEAFRARYEAETRSIYESFGYRFTWVPADGMIADGGAVHCTTMQIAR